MSKTPVQSDALAALRVRIDQLDQQLLSMLNQRASVAKEVGEIKRAEGSPFFRPDRVAQVIQKISAANPGPRVGARGPPAPPGQRTAAAAAAAWACCRGGRQGGQAGRGEGLRS